MRDNSGNGWYCSDTYFMEDIFPVAHRISMRYLCHAIRNQPSVLCFYQLVVLKYHTRHHNGHAGRLQSPGEGAGRNGRRSDSRAYRLSLYGHSQPRFLLQRGGALLPFETFTSKLNPASPLEPGLCREKIT